MGSSDLTCLQVFNALSWAHQAGRWNPDLPFNVFLEEYQRERQRKYADAPRQQVGDRPPGAAGGLPREAGLPSGSTGGSESRAARFAREAETATVVVTPPHHTAVE